MPRYPRAALRKAPEALRFRGAFSLNDIGCGYGALVAFLAARYPAAIVDYLGLDVSPVMVNLARRQHPGGARRHFVVGQTSSRVADYSVASGVMNVKLAHPRDRWEAYVAELLRDMHCTSRLGFAINFMCAAESTAAPADEPLYRTDADRWIRFCQTKLGCTVETVTGYGMLEFTLLDRPR